MATFTKQAFLPGLTFLLLALFQTFCFTACDEQQDAPLKTIYVLNITDPIEISEAGKDKIIAESNNNPSVTFRQEAGKLVIDPEGLCLISLFLDAGPVNSLITDILNNNISAGDIIEFGQAIALAKVRQSVAERHILTLSTDVSELGFYWDGGGSSGTGHRICTMLITPDARFVLRIDFSKSEFGNLPEYRLNYRKGVDMETVFEVDSVNLPQVLLPNDVVDYFLGRFS
jgi:hypothetical protein